MRGNAGSRCFLRYLPIVRILSILPFCCAGTSNHSSPSGFFNDLQPTDTVVQGWPFSDKTA